jgi:hypothetical protein
MFQRNISLTTSHFDAMTVKFITDINLAATGGRYGAITVPDRPSNNGFPGPHSDSHGYGA